MQENHMCYGYQELDEILNIYLPLYIVSSVLKCSLNKMYSSVSESGKITTP